MASPAEPDFHARAGELLQGLLAKLDDFDPDELEADLSSGVLKIGFADGRNCILNRQAAASQIWLAEGATAYHFAFDPAHRRWMDTKARGSLESILSQILSRRLGRQITL